MSIPEGWRPLDFDGHFDHLDTHFIAHVGPLYIRESETESQLGFEVLSHMCNPAGICHGGMLMTVMDVGLVFILHAKLGGHVFTPTMSMNMDFVSPGKKGDFLICEGACTRASKSTGFVSGQLVGSDGVVITGSAIMKITKIGFDAA